MKQALFGGLTTFASCWLLHLIMWRIRRPKEYPIWMPVIFWLTPAVGSVVWLGGHGRLAILLQPAGDGFAWIAAALLHGVLSLCYMCGYAGVIEYSPSAEILLVVRQAMPEGVMIESLEVDSLTEYALTGKRIEHLLGGRMIDRKGENLRLTRTGSAVLFICKMYRLLFGIQGEGRG